MRVILDTNVLVAALRSDMGASYAIVSQLPSERFQMALTVPLYLQYQDVLTRLEHMTGASTRDEVLNFLRYLCSIAHRQRVFFLWRPCGSKIRKMTWCWKPRWRLKVATSLHTISATLPGAGLRSI